MFYSTRAKLLAGFLGVTLLVGVVSLVIGVHLIDRNVFGEALNRVQRDLNALSAVFPLEASEGRWGRMAAPCAPARH